VARAIGVLGSVLAIAGCGDDGAITWEIAGTRNAAALRAEVRRGGCSSSDVLYAEERPVASWAPAPVPALERGVWGFAADAFDDGCRRIAQGCTEIDLPSEGNLVTTTLSDIAPAPTCLGGVCRSGSCGPRTDGGREDGGGSLDGGRDGGTDASVESICETFAGALLCETFDADELPVPPWTVDGDDNGLSISRDAYRGEGALDAEVDSAGSGMLQNMSFGSFTRGEQVYARLYLYIDASSLDGATTGTQTIFALSGAGSRSDGATLRYDGDRFELRVPGAAWTEVELPVDRWFCAELGVLVDTSTGGATFSVDGTVERAFVGVTTMPVSGRIDTVSVGVYAPTTADEGVHLFADELVIAATPIGCD
jgi:hypothetical protein